MLWPVKANVQLSIEEFMRIYVNHITKAEFLCAFHKAYLASMGENNIRGGFAATGLVLYNP